MDIELHYRTIAPKLTNTLVADGTDYASACDIVQETFLRIWRMRAEVVDDAALISGLAYTIARRLRLDHFRKSSREELVDEVPETAASPAATLPSDVAYLRQRLLAALATLPPLLREAFTLFQVQELSVAEIAQLTKTTENSVKVRLFRAREKLKPLLEDLLV